MIDQAVIEFDKALRTVFAPARSVRPVRARPFRRLSLAKRSVAMLRR